MIYTIVGHVQEVVKQIVRELFLCTMPLVAPLGNSDTLEGVKTNFIGTSVAVRQHGSHVFVLTANHVANEAGGPDNVFVLSTPSNGDQELYSFGGIYLSPSPIGLESFDFDVGRFTASPEIVDSAGIRPFAGPIGNGDWYYPGGSFYLVFGYPASSIKATPSMRQTKMIPRSIVALPADSNVSSYHADLQLMLKYDLKNQAKIEGDGTRKGIHPAGMSGSGVYQVSLLPNSDGIHTVTLDGILTDYDKKNRMLIATRLDYLVGKGFLDNV